jgi:aminoglycoside phosphotransferase (APT) family kinase protein
MAREAPATRSAHVIDVDAVDRWLAGHVPEYRGPGTIEKFAGGQSNPTYRLDSPSGRYVLRRKPFGPLLPSAHAVDREFRVISALYPHGFPVARPLALCLDQSVIGAEFYVMDFVDGRAFWDGAMPDATPAERRAIYESMISALARLHCIDPGAVGLGEYGPPGNYFERQVRRWTKQYRASQTDDLEDVERLIEWLPATLPRQDRVAIIHGDYRIDNLIYARDTPSVSAILDWELSTLGDPLADFAYLAMNWVTPREDRPASLGRLDLVSLGIPTLDEAVDLYCRLTNREGVPDLNWYFAYNLFRLMGIVQGIKKRFLDGNASSAQAEKAATRVAPLAASAWGFAQRAMANTKA